MLIRPSRDAIHRLVRMALEEDAPWGDLTSQSLIPASAQVTARLVAREPGVLSGEDVFTAAMSLTDPAISTRFHLHDAETFAEATVLATIEGPAQGVLQAERVALNFVQRMSRHRHPNRAICISRCRDPGADRRHAQDNAGAPASRTVCRPLRRWPQSPLLTFRCRYGQGQSSCGPGCRWRR